MWIPAENIKRIGVTFCKEVVHSVTDINAVKFHLGRGDHTPDICIYIYIF